MKLTFICALLVVLAGCGSSVSGKYDCGRNLIQRFDFRSGDSVYVTMATTGELPATYKVDGEKIAITMSNGAAMVLTKKGDVISGDVGLGKLSCKKG